MENVVRVGAARRPDAKEALRRQIGHVRLQ
jgi:hypothetical protein